MPLCRVIITIVCLIVPAASAREGPTVDDGSWFVLSAPETELGQHHTRHAEVFGAHIQGFNRAVLQAVDKVQATQPQGGGYFTGVKAKPAESPIGYPLSLFGQPLLSPPRSTSYCSGSSYAAFIESINIIFPDGAGRLSTDRLEAFRLQEPDGGRREDGVKFWGHWNDDGPGSQYALVQYSGAGTALEPLHARPGDFMNINWKSGLGHSVVFLGWYKDDQGRKSVLYWSSQKGTNGLGDQMSPIDKIASVKLVRLTHPENLFTYDISTPVNRKVPGDKIQF
jgi:hypothetical protein